MHERACNVVWQGDPFKTLFLARASYQVTERELKRIFGDYGPIRNIRIVRDSNTGGNNELIRKC